MKARNCIIPVAVVSLATAAFAADWPMWGRTLTRNMVSDEKNVPTVFSPGKLKGNTEEIDIATTQNVAWVAKVGSQTYGNPTVSGGLVFVGTNNESPRDPETKGDRGILMCLDEKTGELKWQLAVPKLGTGKVSDWEFLGLCSSPAVEGDRVYIVTNRNEVMCLTTKGLAGENVGPFKDEAQYKAGPGKPPAKIGPKDADIVWVFDMRKELGVFPHNITNCGPLIIGDRIVVTTSNGVDWTHTNMPNPKAPALCVLDKNTGKLWGEEASGVSSRTLHSNWSSPTGGMVDGKPLIIFGGGDGWLYGFDGEKTKDDDGVNVLIEKWKLDCNPPNYRMKDGKPLKYATYDGPSEVIATPVFHNNRVYVPIGQDPEHGEGVGRLVCVDATKSGDLSKDGVIWSYDKIHRSLSTPAVVDGLVICPDFSGFIHCVDAETGKPYWVYDTKSHVWGSPMVADGKIYVGTEDGDIVILEASKTMKLVGKVDMRAPIYSSPIFANGTLYICTQTHLYAVRNGKAASAAPKTGGVKTAAVRSSTPVSAKRAGLCTCRTQSNRQTIARGVRS
jgi:outer membrane protein assembly factor BamB